MKCDEYGSPAFASLHNVPYNSSLASSASVSSTSVWSDASSQNSDDISITATTSISDSYDSCTSRPAILTHGSDPTCGTKFNNPWAWQAHQSAPEIPPELRSNPRRTAHSATTRTGCPPTLVRQADRKVNFVDNLVDSSTHIVEAVWPTSSVICRNEHGSTGVLPLRTFIQETLRRSRTSYSTLQVALYYLLLIKPHVPARDFTMEQPDDCYASRAIQCGRRMFLAALILASKYLQDRNYSARAWSKISGLHTHEINQNEIAFLLAVNWKLHITDDVYNRWTDCVMRFTPSQPPSSGGPAAQRIFDQQCDDFRHIILNLRPDLDNLEQLTSLSSAPTQHSPIRSLFTPPNERVCGFGQDGDVTPLAKPLSAPVLMEPNPVTVHTPGRLAPAMGLLPTPRLTPQSSGFSTPAVSAASYLLNRPSMSFALNQATGTSAAQSLDRWPASLTSSPQSYITRRSSLVNSVSTASSPESMVSDTSRSSRSSSISSASSLASAPLSRSDVQARCRFGKSSGERINLMPTIISEDNEENCMTSSPESFTGTVNKDLNGLRVDTSYDRREREMREAACALQELHNHGRVAASNAVPKAGLKRSRTTSMDRPLQENVRELLAGHSLVGEPSWPDSFIRPRAGFADRSQQIAVRATVEGARKRFCCAAEAAGSNTIPPLHSAIGGFRGPGMWEGVLN